MSTSQFEINDSADKNTMWRRPSLDTYRGTVRVLDDKYYGRRSKGSYHKSHKGYQGAGKNRNDEKLSPVVKTTVQNLNLDCVKPQRAGVIMYTVFNGTTYFGVGLDSKTHDITDFGGGVVYKIDKNVIYGALREFDEEILSCIKPLTPDDVQNCPVIYDSNNLIIFVHITVNPDEMCRVFNNKYNAIIKANSKAELRKPKDPEVCAITWLTWEEFQYSIKSKNIMFTRVRNFLQRAEDFSYLL